MRAAVDWLGRGALPLVAATLFLLFGLESPRFLTAANMANLLLQTAPLTVATVGQTLVIAGGGLDISVGSIVAFASVVGALGAIHAGAVVGALAFLLSGCALGAANGWVVAWLEVSPVLTTIAMLTFARGAALLITNGQPVSGLPPVFFSLSWGRWLGVPAPAWIALGVLGAAHYLLQNSDLGLYLRGAGRNPEAARLSGVRVRPYRLLPYLLSGLTAGLAALMYAGQAGSGQPTFGNGLELATIAAAVIGGTSLGGGQGDLWGAALGALIITTLSNGMILMGVTPYIQVIALGFAIIAAVVWDHFRRWLERLAAQIASA